MESLSLGFDFLIFLVVILIGIALAAVSIIAAIVFTIEALEKRLPARMLIVFWLLFIPAIMMWLCYGLFEGISVYLFSMPFSTAILIYYKRTILKLSKI
jgi:hypothetical protein